MTVLGTVAEAERSAPVEACAADGDPTGRGTVVGRARISTNDTIR
jgi:hypothetical protein